MLENEIKKCCFTGYRPSKLPFNIACRDSNYISFENSLIDEILMLVKNNCLVFYSGMAMGFDIIAAEVVLLLKQTTHLPLKLVCVIPFKEQAKNFNDFWRAKYERILNECDEIIVLAENYSKNCYQLRNIYMVDNCDYVLTWFDGKSGGTMNTINYALKKGRHIFNINKACETDSAVQTCFKLL